MIDIYSYIVSSVSCISSASTIEMVYTEGYSYIAIAIAI